MLRMRLVAVLSVRIAQGLFVRFQGVRAQPRALLELHPFGREDARHHWVSSGLAALVPLLVIKNVTAACRAVAGEKKQRKVDQACGSVRVERREGVGAHSQE